MKLVEAKTLQAMQREAELARRRSSVFSRSLDELQHLAVSYHTAYCLMASLNDAEARKPGERYCSMIWHVGRYLYDDEWVAMLRDNFEWPRPVSQTGAEMTQRFGEIK